MLSYLQTLETIKNIGKVLYFVSSLHIQSDVTKLYKTILHQNISANSSLYQYSYLSECNVGKKLGILWLLNISVDPVCQSWHHMDMGSIAVVTGIPAVSIFKVK
jgi:hypothetical protein